jgi:hypothetical protein
MSLNSNSKEILEITYNLSKKLTKNSNTFLIENFEKFKNVSLFLIDIFFSQFCTPFLSGEFCVLKFKYTSFTSNSMTVCVYVFVYACVCICNVYACVCK